ncbi:MAG: hypothetical protein SAK29_00455 [Scytonema sp. PMC 1069.18]|nr:hypothetical protein [Scytonema sp. PMC 1069.18]MEC4882589.1 hypothetical protein [Scytonema sp. PMC 1070.18]
MILHLYAIGTCLLDQVNEFERLSDRNFIFDHTTLQVVGYIHAFHLSW